MNKTDIDYLDYTWNPLAMRCTPVSESCEHCWHLRMANRLNCNPKIPHNIRLAHGGNAPPILVTQRLDDPLKVKKPSIIGVQFMGDLFHEDVEWNDIRDVFQVISETIHTYLILTKRPEQMKAYCEYYMAREVVLPGNLWLGVTAENQQRADERIPILLQIPAAKRFVSLEPLLSSIDLTDIELTASIRLDALRGGGDIQGLDWVIVGGETGPGTRLMNPYWARAVLLRCQGAGVPFFFKNMSQKKPTPDDLMIRDSPK